VQNRSSIAQQARTNSRKPDEFLHPRTSANRLEARLSINPPTN
jgi:hypothetical protein